MKYKETKIRVRYGETDQMGIVYHGNYAQYLEIGRIEWLREMGISYKKIEEQGVMLPVVSLSLNYKKSVGYDAIIYIRTRLVKPPTVSIEFEFELLNENREIITLAKTKLAFISIKTNKLIRCPKYILEKMQI